MRTHFDHHLDPSSHALIVGGTGMLRAASITLAESARAITSIARTRRSLEALDVAFGGRCAHEIIPLDYRRSETLRSSIAGAIERSGPIDLVVAWVHESVAPDAPLIIAEAAIARSPRVRYVHILGSTSSDPAMNVESIARQFGALSGLDYRQVVLGWAESAGRPRWLTDAEISAGVVEALARDERIERVGIVEPWSARP